MNEKEQGVVIPFRLSGSKMRSRAVQYRRQGQVLDALLLVRRAAEQDDTASAWQALAAELRQLGCWEAAADVTARVLSREDRAPSAWLDMARCQSALGQKELATDCLYHLLQENPWSQEGDAARVMLPELAPAQERPGPRRAPRLATRGMQAWYAGALPLAERRLRRAARLTDKKEQLMVTVGLMYLLRWDIPGAGRWLAQALRRDPHSPRALCGYSAVCQQQGKRRMARAFLRKALPWCLSSRMEEQFLTTAWVLDAWPEMAQYLELRLKRDPYRTTLLGAKAALRYEQGRLEEAQQLWRQVLSIDPHDRRTSALLAWTKEQEDFPVLPPPGRLPHDEQEAQRASFREFPRGTDLLQPGSRERILLEWFAVSADAQEQQMAIDAIAAQQDKPAVICFLRELLARPGVEPAVCQWAIVHLAELGCTQPLTLLAGNCYTTVQCQRVERKTPPSPWHIFLPLLLQETRRRRQSVQIAHFAAMLWQQMTPAQRQDAAGSGGYLWCKAMEVLWLRLSGQEEEAVSLVTDMPVSPRRVSRILRQLAKAIRYDPEIPEEE